MFRSTVTVHSGFEGLDARLEQLARRATAAAARAAAETAQANASIDLELEQLAPERDPDGVAAGIRSRKTGNRGTRIADFFDEGTLGKRVKKPKRAGRSSWTVTRKRGEPYTAERGDVAGKGIKPERFFPKARSAGRKALVAEIERGA